MSEDIEKIIYKAEKDVSDTYKNILAYIVSRKEILEEPSRMYDKDNSEYLELCTIENSLRLILKTRAILR